jgi:diguanylate cyclase (GGDEF)-like protein
MLSPFNLLLITAVFSIVMLFVLGSLKRSGIPGIKEWLIANGMATVSLLLFAGRGVIAPFLSIEIANGLLAAAICMIYVGFRRFFACSVPTKTLAVSLAVMMIFIVVFHYGQDSIAARTVTVSIFHGAICLTVAWTIFKYARALLSRYPYRFTACVAVLFACGHWFRGLIYATGTDVLTSNIQTSSWNILFLSIGTLVLPVFTMGAVMIVHDKMMAKATDDANRDFLTGAWSRRAFGEFAERELLRVRRNGRALSLLVFDVDYFKRVNDTYGHAMGDRVLLDIVQRAEKEIRSMDYIARLGGEEFAVLLPEVDAASALIVAERLRAALENHASGNPQTHSRHDVPYTVSIGVGTLNASESIAELLHRADIALYDAKASGRNKVITATA